MTHNINIDEAQFQAMMRLLAANPQDFFLSPVCRQFFSRDTFEKRAAPVRELQDTADGTMPGTISHNRRAIDGAVFKSPHRTLRLINPLSSIQDVFLGAARMKVLSIGPRTDMELLHLVGVGFKPGNITGLDLISTTPWIDLGDMHALPYPAQSFNVVVSGWVLGYSSNAQKAMDEMLRVVKPGGLLAIGCTYNPEAAAIEYQDADAKIQGRIFRKVSELTDMIGSRLDKIYFQHEPDENEKSVVMLIARIR